MGMDQNTESGFLFSINHRVVGVPNFDPYPHRHLTGWSELSKSNF